ncbi:MAG: hypothetical protein ACRD21_20690, partial [Vicinamibacteria bacterium]
MRKASLEENLEENKMAVPSHPVSAPLGVQLAGENGTSLDWARTARGSRKTSKTTSIPVSPDCYRLEYRVWRL